jgi:hypothetical protein
MNIGHLPRKNRKEGLGSRGRSNWSKKAPTSSLRVVGCGACIFLILILLKTNDEHNKCGKRNVPRLIPKTLMQQEILT